MLLVPLVAALVLGLHASIRTVPGRAQPAATVLIAQIGEFGPVLTGTNGMTLYVFDRDQPGQSNCADRCAEIWPPLLLEEGDPVAPEGLAGTLSVIIRPEGSRQVAYNDRPLYFYIGDSQPGDTTGEGVGGVWHVARVEEASRSQPAATATATPAPSPPPSSPTPSPPPSPTPVATSAPASTPAPMMPPGYSPYGMYP